MKHDDPDMDVLINVADWETQRALARPLRYAVFVMEQKVPVELEWDEMDAASLHAVACNAQGVAIGTGRLLPDGHIGRMAVLESARGHGVGGAVLQALMVHAKQRGDREVVLNAQVHAQRFYERFGFERVESGDGAIFMDAGIPHVCMRHRFT